MDEEAGAAAVFEAENRLILLDNDVLNIDMMTSTMTRLNSTNCRLAGFAASKINDFEIFITGGVESNDCELLKNNAFYHLPSMQNNRWLHNTLCFDNKIFACGGYRNDTAEFFDFQEMTWYNAPSMPYCTADFGLVERNGILYAIESGLTNINDIHVIQQYDMRINRWQNLFPINELDLHPRITKAKLYNDKIFCFTADMVYTYDIENNTLQFLCNYLNNDILYPFEPFIYNDNLCLFGRFKANNRYRLMKYNKNNRVFEDYLNINDFTYNGYGLHIF